MNRTSHLPAASRHRIERIRQCLVAWYKAEKRDLPWRQTSDPYRIWVSEVMLQQTQVAAVIPYYLKFLQHFPTLDQLAAADLQAVLKQWEGLGYYARARNMHRAAKELTAHHGSRFPDTLRALKKLPGIGDYIAAAVASIAFGHPAAVVDGNVKRVLARVHCIDSPVNAPRSHQVFQAAATNLLDTTCPGTFNQAVMELGALVCKPDAPLCAACPIAGQCLALERRKTAALPVRLQKKAVPTNHVAVGVIWKNGRTLITRRKPDGLLGGLWEFPGGKIRPGERPDTACEREIKEETGLTVAAVEQIAQVKHAYTHFKIVMHVFSCRFLSGRVRLDGPVDFRWIAVEDIGAYPFPGANHKFFPALRAASHPAAAAPEKSSFP